ncbi:hypothetical protein [Spirosoma agri]
MAINKAPDNLPKPVKAISETKIQDFINRGGKPTQALANTTGSVGTKSIKLIMTDSEMSTIKELRNRRPSRSRKIPISVHDWVIEAIQEKIERERKKYGVTSN